MSGSTTATPAISPGQEEALAGDEKLSQPKADALEEAAILAGGMLHLVFQTILANCFSLISVYFEMNFSLKLTPLPHCVASHPPLRDFQARLKCCWVLIHIPAGHFAHILQLLGHLPSCP